ncbi:MAG: UDP-N-acetylglucosamine 2-epimerase (non-hydrolyzing) [Actinobacteria bacterium]|nr:UDP-N-acetylglucosamine 2-epimerase (non-hydrolyzing) [Actinomycetota bacterium]
MKIANVVGARPQFIKAAAVCRALRARAGVTDLLVHTGQHYDAEMSDVFFDQLDLPKPQRYLGVGGGSHAGMTAAMLVALEGVVNEENPDLVVVYGDTNTTLAAALVAAKLQIPLGHVEAGLRSYNRSMPEEINRVVADHLSQALFCPTQTAVGNLHKEGVTAGVHMVGDVMNDILQLSLAHKNDAVLKEIGVEPGGYHLMTLHRAGNTDDTARLEAIVRAVGKLDRPVVFPVHPRTRKAMEAAGIKPEDRVHAIAPVGYFDFLALQSGARSILTDSGGVQKEAYMLGVPCVTLRAETEWPETVEAGWNILVDADAEEIIAGAERTPPPDRPGLYGDGHAAERIVELCEDLVR